MLQLQATEVPITRVQVYAPMSESNEEDIDQFYADINTTLKDLKSITVTIVLDELIIMKT